MPTPAVRPNRSCVPTVLKISLLIVVLVFLGMNGNETTEALAQVDVVTVEVLQELVQKLLDLDAALAQFSQDARDHFGTHIGKLNDIIRVLDEICFLLSPCDDELLTLKTQAQALTANIAEKNAAFDAENAFFRNELEKLTDLIKNRITDVQNGLLQPALTQTELQFAIVFIRAVASFLANTVGKFTEAETLAQLLNDFASAL